MIFRTSAFAGLAFTLLAFGSLAAPPGEAELTEGLRLERTGDCVHAAPKLEEAFRLSAKRNALMQAGYCYRQLHDYKAATDAYLRFLKTNPPESEEARARELLAQTDLEERKYRQEHPEQAPIPVTIVAKEGLPVTPTNTPAPAPVPHDATAPQKPPPPEASNSLRTVSYVALGAGAACAIGGTIFGLQAKSNANSLGQISDSAQYQAKYNDATSSAHVSTGLWIGAAALAAAGTAFLAFSF